MSEQKYITVKYGMKQHRDSIECSDADAYLLARERLTALEVQIAAIWRSAQAPLGFTLMVLVVVALMGKGSDAAIIIAIFIAAFIYFIAEGTRLILNFLHTKPEPVFTLFAYKLPRLYARKRAWARKVAIMKSAPDYFTTDSR